MCIYIFSVLLLSMGLCKKEDILFIYSLFFLYKLRFMGPDIVLDPNDFHCTDKNFLGNIIYIPQKKISHTVLKQHEGDWMIDTGVSKMVHFVVAHSLTMFFPLARHQSVDFSWYELPLWFINTSKCSIFINRPGKENETWVWRGHLQLNLEGTEDEAHLFMVHRWCRVCVFLSWPMAFRQG